MRTINQEIKKEALDMYLRGIPVTVIGKKLGKNKNTIQNWKKRFNWAQYQEKFEEEQKKQAVETNEERKQRLLKLTKKIQNKFNESLPQQEIKPNEAIKAMEFESRLIGLEETKIKVEMDSAPIQINIIKPDDDGDNE